MFALQQGYIHASTSTSPAASSFFFCVTNINWHNSCEHVTVELFQVNHFLCFNLNFNEQKFWIVLVNDNNPDVMSPMMSEPVTVALDLHNAVVYQVYIHIYSLRVSVDGCQSVWSMIGWHMFDNERERHSLPVCLSVSLLFRCNYDPPSRVLWV